MRCSLSEVHEVSSSNLPWAMKKVTVSTFTTEIVLSLITGIIPDQREGVTTDVFRTLQWVGVARPRCCKERPTVILKQDTITSLQITRNPAWCVVN